MLVDDYGRKIVKGSRLRIIVGIPGREVMATVVVKAGGLYAKSDNEGGMSVRRALTLYPVEVIE